jgi:hypothetical protein
MSTKKAKINPLLLVAAKQRVGQDDADQIALPVLAWFDAAKRGRCTNVGCNHLTTHLIIATYIAARTKSKAFHDACIKAYNMLHKAAGRPGDLALTTPEYSALRVAFGWYLRGLPQCDVGTLNLACKEAERIMGA